jgi:purine-binding chemotaxis protein CheW
MSTAVIQTNQFLTFSLDGEHYAVGVGSVREVLEKNEITRMPKTPDYMRGIINIRGSVVPIIDLRLKLGLPVIEDTVDTCIIVTEIELEDDEVMVLGLMVDSVDEVVEIKADEIDPAPKIGHRIDTDFIAGIGKLEERFIIILNGREIFEVAELNILTQAVE